MLDFVEGYTLAEWVERTHPTARETVHVFMKLTSALALMHERGVFHRDLKLANIMVRAVDGAPFILDFGAGDILQAEDLTDAPLPPGTRRYRAPEATRFLRRNGHKLDARYDFKVTDDVYALGVCLYDVLTAPSPLSEGPPGPVEGGILPPSARMLNPRVPAALSDVAMRFIARKPEHRPPTGEAMRRELEALASQEGPEWTTPLHEPQAAPRREGEVHTEPSKPGRSRRVWLASLLGVLLVAGIALGVLAERRGLPSESPPETTPNAPLTSSDAFSLEFDWVPGSVAAPAPPTASTPGIASTPPEPPLKERPSVKRAPAVDSPKNSPGRNAPPASLSGRAKFLAKCASVSAAVALELGCPGSAQLRPSPGACPDEARTAMWDVLKVSKRGEASVQLILDMTRPGASNETNVYRGEGAIIGIVDDGKRGNGGPGIPTGTVLHGHFWTGDGRFMARYTEAHLPDGGGTYPVCIAAGPLDGWTGSKPGEVVFSRSIPAYIVNRWP